MYYFKLGATGAAISTALSQYIVTFLLIWHLNKRAVLLPPKLGSLQFGGYLKSGGFLLGRTLAVLITMTLGTSMAARQGPVAMAAHQICIQVWLAVSLLTDALAAAGQVNLIEYRNIIIDAQSSVSGAGRGAKEANLYTEIAERIYSYGITRHCHVPEIEQGLSDAANSKITVNFTPHLMPMIRGMQSTIYLEMAPGVTIEDLYQQLKISYEDEEFVVLLERGVVPRTHNVRGSNYCFINVFPDRIPGRAIITSVKLVAD
ncbi:hypothetical protein RGQ29_014067 [Quercus rubra]|uniref:N-acetyl-gamma-glutamyl-phosphate reductase dimerisation domain-containing protein n=1 Tax=Quercus rubra TaxID=3512 RepID=A0AAN7FKW9_QUERU|nr:hypothetical protein RGQ29_014067 [Quercus rubra]KAK4595818.1 hypothetical protein RGQ29_014067 [Quercus rubra]KAK4595819.1 hypothetical protein RGQ29_014067 [Quercus rubra]